MISFKDYISEAQNGILSAKEAHSVISSRRWKTITSHKWFSDYMHIPQSVNIPIGFKIDDRLAFDEIFVAHGPMGDDKLRRMLRFTFSKDKLINIDLYQNWRDEKIGDSIKWKHIKRLKKVDEENEIGYEGTDKLVRNYKKITPGEKLKTPDMFLGWDKEENIKKDK